MLCFGSVLEYTLFSLSFFRSSYCSYASYAIFWGYFGPVAPTSNFLDSFHYLTPSLLHLATHCKNGISISTKIPLEFFLFEIPIHKNFYLFMRYFLSFPRFLLVFKIQIYEFLLFLDLFCADFFVFVNMILFRLIL